MASELVLVQPKGEPVKIQESLDSFSFANTVWETLFRTFPFRSIGSKEDQTDLKIADSLLLKHYKNNVAQDLPDEIPTKYRS